MTQRWNAGVIPYAEMGYWEPDYEPQPDGHTPRLPDHAAARCAPGGGWAPRSRVSRSTATWTVVWTDRLTDHVHYQAKCYRIDPVPGADGQFIAYIAYDIDLFEEGSIANLTSSDHRQRFRVQGPEGAAPGRHAHPVAYTKTFQGPAARHRCGTRVPRTSTAVRCSARRSNPSWACPHATTAGWSTRRCAAGSTSPRTTRTSTPSRSCAGATGSCSAWKR